MKKLLLVFLFISGIAFGQGPAILVVAKAVPNNEQTIILTSNSTDSIWSPQEIINTGNTLRWEVSGGVTIAETEENDPIFDFRNNTGIATITIKSVSNFIGLTSMQMDNSEILSADISKATELQKIDFYPSELGSIDLTNNTALEYIWLQDCDLNSFDLQANTSASSVYLDFNNNLDNATLEKIIVDLDNNGVTNGVLRINTNPGLPLTSSVYDEYQSLIAKGWTIDASSPSNPLPPSEGYPLLANFRINNSYPNRIYFDSNEIITASTVTGFTVTDNTVSSVSIATNQTSGHYFTVGTDFDYWDNNTIRYAGGSNIQDSENNSVHPFDLQYIENNINQPTPQREKYVTLTGAGMHNGDLGNEWTLQEAMVLATAGTLVHVPKNVYTGTYSVVNNGTATNPIVFQGYNTTPGDEPSITMTQNMTLDSSVMPYLQGTGTGTALMVNRSYIIVKNMIAYDYEYGFRVDSDQTGVNFDNVYARKFTQAGIDLLESDSWENRVLNSYSSDALGQGIKVSGDRHMIDNCYVSSYGTVNMDYYISFKGSNNGLQEGIIRRCNIIRDPNTTHTGHGISLRGNSEKVENVLVEDCYLENVGSPIELRTDWVKYCVIRDVTVDNQKNTAGTYQAIRITGGQYNILDKVTAINSEIFVQFLGSTESEEYGVIPIDAGNNNTFKNCIGYGTDGWTSSYVIFLRTDARTDLKRAPNNNTFINCTFTGYGNLTLYGEINSGTGNKMINTILNDIPNKDLNNSSQWDFEYSDSWDIWQLNGTPLSGTANISVNPSFTGIYTPTNSSLKSGNITDVKYDYNDNERSEINPTIGAIEIE